MWLQIVQIVGTIFGQIGNYVAAPVGRQFAYLFCYKRNIDNYNEKVKKLGVRGNDVQVQVDAAKTKGEIVRREVEQWLKSLDELDKDTKKISEDEVQANKGCLKGWCPNLKSRYSLSRKATKKAIKLAEIYGEGNFHTVSCGPALPPGIESRPTGAEGHKAGFESRRLVMEDVMEALKDNTINVIGICGMGGVGKTTMAKEVAKRAKEENLFDEVVMAVVSQNSDEWKIQDEIADLLHLTLTAKSVSGRADELRARLKSLKRILVILDDVWKRLELNDIIGIPFGEDDNDDDKDNNKDDDDAHKVCKLLLTSRNVDVCNHMRARKQFIVDRLLEEEAWMLFKKMAGISDDKATELHSVQNAVMKECGGLPIAIITVGRALNGRSKPSWDSALEQLRKSIIKNILGVTAGVYKSLELSYNYVESEEAKNCFLLCCLFPEDFDVPIEDVVRYGYGLELFKGTDKLGEARNRVLGFIEDLKNCFLLMDSGKVQDSVKMHDVVRDVAISIASEKEHSFMVRCDEALKEWPDNERHKSYAAISMRCTSMHGLPDNLKFPNLQLLRLHYNDVPLPWSRYARKSAFTADTFYAGMNKLKVVDLIGMIGSLPAASLRRLANLQTLSLKYCHLIDDDISVIGELENLEMLSLFGSRINEFPKKIGQLTHLKLLDLRECRVEIFYLEVLSKLSKLEEFYVGLSFVLSQFVGESGDVLFGISREANITHELASLPNLIALDIALQYMPRALVFEKLMHFAIHIDSRDPHGWTSYGIPLPNRIELDLRSLSMSDITESGLKSLLKRTQILDLRSIKGSKNIICDVFEQLTRLKVNYCDDLEFLINATDMVPLRAFPVLEFLDLGYLNNFKGIFCGQCQRLQKESFSALKQLILEGLPELIHLWNGPTQLVWLVNLTHVDVRGCPKLGSVFSFSTARNLMQLEKLEITRCSMMEAIVSSEGGEHEIATIEKIEFPKLKYMILAELPSFTAICKDMNEIELPQLEWLELREIPKLKSLCQLFGNKVPTQFEWLGNLTSVKVIDCPKLEYVFSASIARNLTQLEVLKITQCNMMEVIVSSEGGEHEIETTIVMPQLKQLELGDLPKLKNLWPLFDNKVHTQFEWLGNLTCVQVMNCPKLEYVFSASIARNLMQLEVLEITQCNMMEVIVSSEGGEHEVATIGKLEFPKLNYMKLMELPSFIAICKAMNGIVMPQLRDLELKSIPKLKSLFPASENNYDTTNGSLFINKSMQYLQRLTVVECRSLEIAFGLEGLTVMEGHSDILLPSLTNLILDHLPKLKHVWKNTSLGIQGFQNLISLTVKGCGSLKYLLSYSLAKLLGKLDKLEISECVEIEVIVAVESKVDDELTTATIMFPQLTRIKLDHLPNLRRFFSQDYKSSTKILLTNLEVINCPKLKALHSAFRRMQELPENDAGFLEAVQMPDIAATSQSFLLDEKFIRISEEELTVTGIDEPSEVWFSQPLKFGCLDQVEMLQVQCCGKISSLVSSKFMEKLRSLRRLEVWWCDSMEVIFDDDLQDQEVYAEEEEGTNITDQLSKLDLNYLPKLMRIWKNVPYQNHCFSSLNTLKIKRCDNLIFIFTLPMTKALVNLNRLRVEHCENVEKIVATDDDDGEEEEGVKTFFPGLEVVELSYLPSLLCFGLGVNDPRVLSCNLLIEFCPKLPDWYRSGWYGFHRPSTDDSW